MSGDLATWNERVPVKKERKKKKRIKVKITVINKEHGEPKE